MIIDKIFGMPNEIKVSGTIERYPSRVTHTITVAILALRKALTPSTVIDFHVSAIFIYPMYK